MRDKIAFFAHFDALLAPLQLRRRDSGGAHTLDESAPHVTSVHKLATYAGLSMLAAAHAAVALGRARGLPGQDLHLDVSHAAVGLNPERLFAPRLNAKPYASVGIEDNPYLRAPYRTRDGQYIMLSALYPAMAARLTAALGCKATPDAVAACVSTWDGASLEAALAARGVAATLCRSPEGWRAHPQGVALAQTGVVALVCPGPAPARAHGPACRPLAGYRVLSLGRALAGPIAGRTLAEQGADVLGVCNPGHTEHEAVWCEAHVGHRSCALNLNRDADRQALEALLETADVVINNHQSPKMAALGLDAASIQARHPGIVYLGISAFGEMGPWAGRSGFDMNASAATGIMVSEGAGGAPRLPACHLIHDVVAGYLGAAGVAAALRLQSMQGGSFAIHISLARCAMWCQSFGLADTTQSSEMPCGDFVSAPRLIAQTPLGRLERMAPLVNFAKTPSAWRDPILVAQGSSAAQWLPRVVG